MEKYKPKFRIAGIVATSLGSIIMSIINITDAVNFAKPFGLLRLLLKKPL